MKYSWVIIFLFLAVLNTHSTCFNIINVVVNFLCQVIFVFLFFLGVVMYANEVETKEKIKITRENKLTTTYIS